MVRSASRAQLILVGALLVATVILGLSFLLNSLLFTSASGTGETGAAMAETEQLAFELQRGVRSLAVRVNHAKRNVTAGEVATAIESNVTHLGRLYGEAQAAAGAVAISVSYDNASSIRGYRIVQAHDDDFREGDDSPGDWWPVPGPWTPHSQPPVTVGWVTANVDVQDTNATGSIFTVEARNDTAHRVELQLQRDGGNLSVDADTSWGSSTSTVCRSTGGRVLVDLFDGNAFNGDCAFPGVGALDGPVSIRFENTDRIEGRYAIVTNRSTVHVGTSTYLKCVDSAGDGRPPAAADPCAAPVIWSANVTTSVRTDRVSYHNAFNLSVYPRDS